MYPFPKPLALGTQITVSEVEEVFPALGALEALTGELACQQISDEEIETVRVLHTQMLQSYEARDLEAYFAINQFAINQKIHCAILLAARNDTLTTSCQTLSLRVQRACYLANMTEGQWYEAVQEHEKILEFLAARDGKNLVATLVSHMNSKRRSVVQWLKIQEDPLNPRNPSSLSMLLGQFSLVSVCNPTAQPI